MQKTFIGLLLVVTIIVFFAVQNAYLVEVKLWYWTIQSYISLLLIFAIFLGAVTSYLLSLPGRIKRSNILNDKQDRIKELEKIVGELTRQAKADNKEPDEE